MVGPGKTAGELELAFSLPAWAPTAAVQLRQSSSYAEVADEATIQAGSSASLRVPVDTPPGWVEVSVSPGFRPSANGKSPDGRLLGVWCDGIRLVTDGVPTQLSAAATG